MNKKLIVFICIISFLVPFLPSFDYSVSALPYTPSESENSWIDELEIKFQTYLGNNGVVANSDWFNHDYVGGFWNDLLTFCGFEKIPDKDYACSVYEYAITNNQTADMIFNDSAQYIQNVIEEDIPYTIYTTLHKSDISSMCSPKDNESAQFWANFNFTDKTHVLWFGYDSGLLNGNANNGFQIMRLPLDFFDTYSLYFTQPIPDDYFFQRGLFFNRTPNVYDSNTDKLFSLWCASENGIPNQLRVSNGFYNGLQFYWRDSSYDWFLSGSFNIRTQNVIGVFQLPTYYCYVNEWWGTAYNVVGSFFLVDDSIDKFSFMIFKSYNDYYSFINGESQFYKFDNNFNVPDGVNINYDRLYDLISDSIRTNNGNLADTINSLASSYLQQQLDLLHDINNALIDGLGQSWLRRIYGILDYNFPLTLQAFDDLTEAIQNISVSGGGDFSESTRVLHEIDDKLGFLIEQPLADATAQDFDELKSIAGSKFPFCIFSDIVAITVILNRTPRAPDINFPMPTLGSASENVVHVDLTPYEYARPYVHGALIFLFVIGLMALSVKIFSALKG